VGGVGIDSPRFRLPMEISSDEFEQNLANRAFAGSVDSSYESGPLLGDNLEWTFFGVDCIELWAVSVSHEQYQLHQRNGIQATAVREGTRQRVATVDRHQLADDIAIMSSSELFRHRSDLTNQ
jgi:hypothetical protein